MSARRSSRERSLKSPAQDPQREAVYQAEREFRGACWYHELPLAHIQLAVTRICRWYGIPEPELSVRRLPSREFRWAAEWAPPTKTRSARITMWRTRGDNLITLLHEMAHHVDYYRDPLCKEDHNPHWLGIYAYLLGKFKCMPVDAFAVIARRWKLRRKRPEESSPRALRKTIRASLKKHARKKP